MFVWEAMKENSEGEDSFLVPIRKLCFKSGGFNHVGSDRSGLLMR